MTAAAAAAAAAVAVGTYYLCGDKLPFIGRRKLRALEATSTSRAKLDGPPHESCHAPAHGIANTGERRNTGRVCGRLAQESTDKRRRTEKPETTAEPCILSSNEASNTKFASDSEFTLHSVLSVIDMQIELSASL